MIFRLSFLLFLFVLFFPNCSSKSSFELNSGDLLFVSGNSPSQQTNAIKRSTSVPDEISFSHVGILKREEENIYVIEAVMPDGVVKTLLCDFMQKAEKQRGKPLVAVGRLKPQYRYLLPKAIEKAEEFLTKPYDNAYEEGNQAFYCSELVRFAFLDSLQNPIFPPLCMSFKNKETHTTEPYWKKHFAALGMEIPEGKPGTNPADMAKSSYIEIVHTYY